MTRKAFTLIELLVVVAVLALLASIVFSNLGGAREGARISNALSFQSQTHSLLGSDLVGWWNFNEGDARDISGYNNHGTVVGATHVTGVPGTGGSALSFELDNFNGSGDYVTAPFPFFSKQEATVTYSSWVNVRSYKQQWGGNVIVGGQWFHGTAIAIHNGYLRFGMRNLETDVLTRQHSKRLNLNEWYHIAGVYENGDVHLFLNGGKESWLNTGIVTRSLSGNLIIIGRTATNYYTFDGLIDDVRIYNRALTAQEVRALYAQTVHNYAISHDI